MDCNNIINNLCLNINKFQKAIICVFMYVGLDFWFNLIVIYRSTELIKSESKVIILLLLYYLFYICFLFCYFCFLKQFYFLIRLKCAGLYVFSVAIYIFLSNGLFLLFLALLGLLGLNNFFGSDMLPPMLFFIIYAIGALYVVVFKRILEY